MEIAVAAACEIQERAGRPLAVLRAAAQADPEIAALWDTARGQRRRDVRAVTTQLSTAAGVAAGLRDGEVVDVVYALTSPDLYDLFVSESGWRRDRFERWLVDAILRLALGGEPT